MNYIDDKKVKTGLKRLQDDTNIDQLLDDIHQYIDQLLDQKDNTSSD